MPAINSFFYKSQIQSCGLKSVLTLNSPSCAPQRLSPSRSSATSWTEFCSCTASSSRLSTAGLRLAPSIGCFAVVFFFFAYIYLDYTFNNMSKSKKGRVKMKRSSFFPQQILNAKAEKAKKMKPVRVQSGYINLFFPFLESWLRQA